MNLVQQNAKRWNHDYQVGDLVLIRNKGGCKMNSPMGGPFLIVQFFTNRTVTV